MLTIKACPTCGSRRIAKVRRTVTRSIEGRTYEVPNLEFYECPECGEKLYDREASRKIEAYCPNFRPSRRRRQSA